DRSASGAGVDHGVRARPVHRVLRDRRLHEVEADCRWNRSGHQEPRRAHHASADGVSAPDSAARSGRSARGFRNQERGRDVHVDMLWLLTLPFRIVFGLLFGLLALPFALLSVPFALLALPFLLLGAILKIIFKLLLLPFVLVAVMLAVVVALFAGSIALLVHLLPIALVAL